MDVVAKVKNGNGTARILHHVRKNWITSFGKNYEYAASQGFLQVNITVDM
jgi:hypothetical protein